MANEDSDPGLRAAAQSARAQRRTAPAIAPPMPPDEMASPFARPTGPRIHSISREIAQGPFEPPAQPASKAKIAKDPLTSKKDNQREKASKLIDALLVKWYAEAKKNIPQADRNLALQLMLNGSALIECGFPLDTLRNLIELKQRLLVSSIDDDTGTEDAMTVHKWMSREDKPKGDEEEPEETE